MHKKILLLGSGELGKELVIALKRLGQYVVAVDSYKNAPAMQVADEFEVINMLDGEALDFLVAKHKPDLIVPEIEAIRTERFYEYEKQGYTVIPSARAANYTMNRKAIRDLAAKELGVKTAKYQYAKNLEELKAAVEVLGLPCVVKPLMSSSGKGQSFVRTQEDIEKAFDVAMAKGRGDYPEVIVEEFINFDFEITLLTVTQNNDETVFCPAIGHRQERGDYQESWQPCPMRDEDYKAACEIARKVTGALTGSGIFGVEFFVGKDGVYFSELSPRPHDTGMVTLAGTQTFTEFELHARAILGLPIPLVKSERVGASAVILCNEDKEVVPVFTGIEDALAEAGTDVRIFGKPITRKYRRMGVALAWLDTLEANEENIKNVREKAFRVASRVKL
ncbi:MAG: formate-dependent phosphoribosylglycinamide formyltransferase [Patescibacteria group bacterium]